MVEDISGIFFRNGMVFPGTSIPDDAEILFLQRAPARSLDRDLWELMGGDVIEGDPPGLTLSQDATKKLNVEIGIAKHVGDVDLLLPDNNRGLVPTRRHIFFACGDYSHLTLDPEKYIQHRWVTPAQINNLPFSPGVSEVLKFAGIIPEKASVNTTTFFRKVFGYT